MVSLLALRLPWTKNGHGYNIHTLFDKYSSFPRWPETPGIDLYIHANRAETVALMVDNR